MDLRCLSLGQASSLVLSLPPPVKVNTALPKKPIKEVRFDITPVSEENDFEPVFLNSYDAKETNNLFSSYPETPPPEDEIATLKKNVFDNNISTFKNILPEGETHSFEDMLFDDEILSDEEIVSDENEKISDHNKKLIQENGNNMYNNEKIKTNVKNYDKVNNSESKKSINNEVYDNHGDKPIASKKIILFFAMAIFSLEKPKSFRHDLMFVTKDIQYEIIKSHLNLGKINPSQLAVIITKGNFVSFMVIYKGVKGRWIYVLRKQHRDSLADQYNLSLSLKYK